MILGGDELYKIGTTKSSPQKRLKSLQTGSPFKLQLLTEYTSTHYKKIEKMLHKRFAEFRTRDKGEWFHLKEHHVFQFEQHCAKAEAAIKLLLELNPFYN